MSYVLRTATPADADAARSVMLDTVYGDLRSGYVPRWHRDIIDVEGTYIRPRRHTLLVAEVEAEAGDAGSGGAAGSGVIVATGAVRDQGPQSPPNPRWVAERFPSGSTAQLCRIYVRPEYRRLGIAREMVRKLSAFVARAGGYRSIYLHTDPSVPGAEPFWRSLAGEVCDERELAEGGSGVVHFELPVPVLAPDVAGQGAGASVGSVTSLTGAGC